MRRLRCSETWGGITNEDVGACPLRSNVVASRGSWPRTIFSSRRNAERLMIACLRKTRVMARKWSVLVTIVLMALPGCASTPSHRDELDRYGRIFFLDGAGSDYPLMSGTETVRAGLVAAGFRGQLSPFVWNTGLGVVVDEVASLSYKRKKGAQLARQIAQYVAAQPERPIHLIAQSAGTAVAAFALEALPRDVQVDSVVFLGSALSRHYDMTAALRQVRGRLHVFTSDRDLILGLAVPLTGTADRQYCGACSAGLHGLHLPDGANAETRRLYSKIENIPWRREFASAGNFGGHTDAVRALFIRRHVAPMLGVARSGHGRGKHDPAL